MTFINFSVLALGGLLVAAPIILHLVMRPRPKHLHFPAIRFLQQRRLSNQRRLKFRQWLLLALRCLAIMMLAFALARPSVANARLSSWGIISLFSLLLLLLIGITTEALVMRRGRWLVGSLAGLTTLAAVGLVYLGLRLIGPSEERLIGDREAPVAAALVIETSPQMAYIYENQTRLERAQEIAAWLVRQLPPDSEIAVLDSRLASIAFAVDEAAAIKSIESLEIAMASQPWDSVVAESLRLLQSSDKSRKELYLFSDLSSAAWESIDSGLLQDQLRDRPELSCQIVDVSAPSPRNLGLLGLQVTPQILATGGSVELQARIRRTGPETSTEVHLHLEQPSERPPIVVDGQLETRPTTLRGKQPIDIATNGEQSVSFSLSSLEPGTHFGYLDLEHEDGLMLDNRLDFAVHVRPPWPLLVIHGRDAVGELLVEAIAPYEFRQSNRARYDCEVVEFSQLDGRRLTDYAAVALLDPPPLADDLWQRLRRYVEQGGGLAIFLGRSVGSAREFNTDAALELLPGALNRQWRDRDGLSFVVRGVEHPIVRPFRDIRANVPWNAMPVYRHWVLDSTTADSTVVLWYSNNQPALIERPVGKGRVAVMTTPITDLARSDQEPWNDVVSSEVSWPFVVLADQLFRYLVQNRDASLNYIVGQVVQLANEAAGTRRVSLLTPRGDWQEVASQSGMIRVPFTDVPGIYRLQYSDGHADVAGFSVNVDTDAIQLDRMPTDRLRQIMGEDHFRLASNQDEITREISQSRIGREFYPYLICVVAVILGLEHLLANRFYKPD